MAEAADLDALILRAEHDIIAREERVMRRVHELGGRLREFTSPRRLVATAAGIAAAVFALGWLWRRGASIGHAGHVQAPRGRKQVVEEHPAGKEVPWVRLIALVWPMLPEGWRARISPATASAVAAIGLPLLERLVAAPPHDPLETVAEVDLQRYAGTWHEIARLPTRYERPCTGQPSAFYAARGNLLEIENRCPEAGGLRVATGIARVVRGSNGARLRVSFLPAWLRWLPVGWGDYWILQLDADYRTALVGTPDRRNLWLLSRTRHLPAATVRAWLAVAHEQGFPTEQAVIVES